MNTEDSEFKRLEHEALLRASQPVQPECSTDLNAPHGFDRNSSHNNHRYTCDCEGWVAQPVQSLQQRLAELHLYEEINEHYAKCNSGAENLRDWVAERMDTESAQPAHEMAHWAEEYECCMMALDSNGVPTVDETDAIYSLWGRICAYARAQPVQPDWLLSSTQDLAKHIARRCYPEVPQFEVLNNLSGVISQIDHMTTGMERKAQPVQPADTAQSPHRMSFEQWQAKHGSNGAAYDIEMQRAGWDGALLCSLDKTIARLEFPSNDEAAIEQLIEERDVREDVLDKVLDMVLGVDRPEWSSSYQYIDAVEGVREALAQPALPLMSASFRTTNSGNGKYEMVFRFRDLNALRTADDEWRNRNAPTHVAQPVQPASRAQLQEAFAQGMSCRPASVQRTWVGLTKDEVIAALWENTHNNDSWELMKRVEAKLKEKNT